MTPHYDNMGDLAMLQASVCRLRTLWPDCRIFVLTLDPERLLSVVANVEPVLVDSRDLWVEQLGQIEQLRGGEADLARDFFDVLSHCDLYILAGMGAFTDVFAEAVMNMLDTIPLAKSLGLPVATLGQGIGPITPASPLWLAVQKTLTLVDLITLREGMFGPRTLNAMGMPAERMLVTGDDAIEIALQHAVPPIGNAIGLNFRRASYSSFSTSSAESIAEVVRDAAACRGVPIVPITISTVAWESDLTTVMEVLPDMDGNLEAPSFPEHVIAQVDKCRVVVSGSYHGAVFALSRGVPALCLSRSPYYSYKFRGLADMFGKGCIVIDVGKDDERHIIKQLNDLWEDALELRPSLIEAARHQLALGRAAYATLSRFTSSETNREWKRATAFSGLLSHWSKRRISILQAELGRTRADLRKIEEARDWHKDQADGARLQLAETTQYLHQVEDARDWHRNRAEALERQYNALLK